MSGKQELITLGVYLLILTVIGLVLFPPIIPFLIIFGALGYYSSWKKDQDQLQDQLQDQDSDSKQDSEPEK